MRSERILVLLVLLGSIFVSHADKIVIPNGFENKMGEGYGAPVLQEGYQIFNKNQFSEIQGPIYITGVSFRAKGDVPNDKITFSKVEISLGTFWETFQGISSLPQGNLEHTENYTTVLQKSNMEWTAPSGASTAFTLPLPFDQPYKYDPQRGHLLFNYFLFTDGFPAYDYESISDIVTDDSPAALLSRFRPGAQSAAFIVQFDYFTVPEPSTVILLLVLALVFSFRLRTTSAI